MSDPQRYSLSEPDISYGMDENSKGEYVLWKDYARLKAEVERLRASSFVTAVSVEEYEKLKAEVERLTVEADWKTPARKIKALEAEVERLHRHGDLLLKFAAANMTYPAYATYAKDWLAAKEGKPSV